MDAFASSVVVPVDGTFDHHKAGDNLDGLYGGLQKLIPDSVIEPYVLWRISPRIRNEAGSIANLSEYTTGVHWVGKLPLNFDYGTEMTSNAAGWARIGYVRGRDTGLRATRSGH